MIVNPSQCSHQFEIYRGRKGQRGEPNWCPICGKIRMKEDIIVEQVLIVNKEDEKDNK